MTHNDFQRNGSTFNRYHTVLGTLEEYGGTSFNIQLSYCMKS